MKLRSNTIYSIYFRVFIENQVMYVNGLYKL